jgi:hypothetical protein
MNFYYSIDGTAVDGPCTLSELTSYFELGMIPNTAQVCQEGAQVWQPLSTVIATGPARPAQTAIAPGNIQRQTVRSSSPTNPNWKVTKACPMCGEEILIAAKKCKHCGELLDATTRAAANPTKEPSDAIGMVIMLLPVASAALMWFWISSMNLLQSPGSTLMGITIVTVLATSTLMAVEASKLGMSSKRGGFLSMGPAGWFICGIGFWIVAFPAYLYYRSKFGVKNYIFGGLASAFVFLGVAVALNVAIELPKSSVLRNPKEGMSKEQIGETTKMSMQQTFDTNSQFKEWQLKVTDVQVLKQGENQYQGIAKVVHDGTTHDVPVDLTVDGLNVIWTTDPGAFLFVAQKELQNLQNILK